MSDPWNDAYFESVINDAKVRHADIADAFDQLEATRQQRLLQHVRAGRAEIEDAARDEYALHDQLTRQAADDARSAESAAVEMAPLFRTLYYTSGAVVTLFWLAVLLAYPLYVLFIGAYDTPWKLVLDTGGWPLLSGVIGASVLLLFVRHRTVSHYEGLKRAAQQRKHASLDIDGTNEKINASRIKLTERAIDAAAQVWRRVINERLRPIYRTAHQFPLQSTLDASVQPGQLVRTPAYSDLVFMLENLPHSSIGIAGPRGAGKSTLLQWVCDEKQTTLGSKKVFAVLTSAPVDYQPRDFLLHLFASLCHRVIERLAPDYDRTKWQQHIDSTGAPGTDVWRALLNGASLACILGTALCISSVIWAVNLSLAPIDAATAAAVSVPARAAPPQQKSAARELGLTPALLLSSSLVLLFGGAIALAAVHVRAHRLPDPGPAPAPAPGPGGSTENPGLRWFSLLAWYSRTRARLTHVDALPASPLLKEALRWLKEIKFQQSYTVGWTGALKMPLGAEGTVTNARSLAQQQLTLPELVDAYKRFLRKISEDSIVLIGIDELDKIDSDEKAQRFLNDIKIVFGVAQVFFLVSVSENAMSQFERRGLPFRDAFDSAFDDVIIVDHLNFKQSRKLLDERILALPVQFQALCHVMSAGLARELVRTLRDLVRVAKESGENAPRPLEQLVKRLVEGEIKAKLAAFRAVTERALPCAPREALLLQMHHIGSNAVTAQSLYDAHLALLPQPAPRRRRGRTAGTTPPTEHAPVFALKEELATYLKFLAAVMRVFTAGLDEAVTRQAELRGSFDDLATARRTQGVNQALASSLVDKVLVDMAIAF